MTELTLTEKQLLLVKVLSRFHPEGGVLLKDECKAMLAYLFADQNDVADILEASEIPVGYEHTLRNLRDIIEENKIADMLELAWYISMKQLMYEETEDES